VGGSRRLPSPPSVILIAGIPIHRGHALVLVRLLGRAGALDTAHRISKALEHDAHDVALQIADRDEVLGVLVECPDGLLELRATLLQEAAWRQAVGL
jgi:hypothetical protein